MIHPMPIMTRFASCLIIACLGLTAGTAVASGETPTATLTCGAGAVKAEAFSPDGRTLAVGSGGSRDVQVWDVKSWRRRHLLKQMRSNAIAFLHSAPDSDALTAFSALAFLPDGRLATCTTTEIMPADWDEAKHKMPGYAEVRVWDVQHGALSQTLTYAAANDPSGPGGSAAASALASLAAPGGQTLLGLPYDHEGLFRLVHWDVRSKATTLVTIRDDDWRRWVTPAVAPGDAHGTMSDLLCAPGGKTLACTLQAFYTGPDDVAPADAGGPPDANTPVPTEITILLLWDTATGRVRRGLTAGTPLAFSPDGATLAALPPDQPDAVRVDLWDPKSGRLVRSLTGLAPSRCAAFTPDGRSLVIGGRDGSVMCCPLADGATRQALRDAPEHPSETDAVQSVAVSSDGRWLAAGFGDGLVRIWRLSGSGQL